MIVQQNSDDDTNEDDGSCILPGNGLTNEQCGICDDWDNPCDCANNYPPSVAIDDCGQCGGNNGCIGCMTSGACNEDYQDDASASPTKSTIPRPFFSSF